MSRLSRPLVYGLLVVLAVVAFVLSGQDQNKALVGTSKKQTKTPLLPADLEFEHADYVAQFDKPKGKARNPFIPVVEAKFGLAVAGAGPSQDLDHIPADYAKGEGNWIFTGLAEVNGVRMALLENSQTHQGSFVKEGESWKTSRVLSITGQSLVLTDSNGSRAVIMRFDPSKASKQTSPAPAAKPGPPGPGPMGPVNPGAPMNGPIGPHFDISPLPAITAGSADGPGGKSP